VVCLDDVRVFESSVFFIRLQILQRCAYLLPMEDRNLQAVVLDIVRAGCKIMRTREKQLLPVIHKVWTSLILLHRGSDLVVLKKVLVLHALLLCVF